MGCSAGKDLTLELRLADGASPPESVRVTLSDDAGERSWGFSMRGRSLPGTLIVRSLRSGPMRSRSPVSARAGRSDCRRRWISGPRLSLTLILAPPLAIAEAPDLLVNPDLLGESRSALQLRRIFL